MSAYSLEGPRWMGGVVTWSFAVPTAGVFSASIGSEYRSLIQSAFQAWDDVIPLTFQQVADGAASADIKVGFWNFGAFGSTIGLTRYTYRSTSAGQVFNSGVTVELENPAELPLTGSLLYTGTVSSLYQVAVHEIGHALGLGHSTDPTAVMYAVATAANRTIGASDLAGIQTLYPGAAFRLTDLTTGLSSTPAASAYAGPVSYLQVQYIYTGSDSIALAASTPNAFLRSGSGDDALSAYDGGQNVLDGGTGSNFLVGGAGTETFFVDGRGGQVSWGTIVNFGAGDSVTLWGFEAGTSSFTWADNAGTAGYTGRTLHADLSGGGSIQDSITFAGLSAADTARFVITTGRAGDAAYLQISNPG